MTAGTLEREDEIMRLLAQEPTVQGRVMTLLMEVQRGTIKAYDAYNAMYLMGFFPSISR